LSRYLLRCNCGVCWCVIRGASGSGAGVGVPAQPIIKSSFANTLDGTNCEAAAHPAVHLDEPPRHGDVCAEIENIKIRSMYYGTQSQCIGRDVAAFA
jgi:hypothetical protein